MKVIDLTQSRSDRPQPFKVPDNYFDDFATHLMAKLPEPVVQEKPQHVTLMTRIKPYLYLAAMISGLAFGIKVYHYQQQYFEQPDNQLAVLTNEQASQYIDDVYDFAMIDGHDIYAFATDEY